MILTDLQQVRCTLDPRNAKGHPAPLDGVPQWASSNPSVAVVEPEPDGLVALVRAIAPGTAQISCVADADLDVDAVREITGTLDIEVKPSEAVTLGIVAGVPERQP